MNIKELKKLIKEALEEEMYVSNDGELRNNNPRIVYVEPSEKDSGYAKGAIGNYNSVLLSNGKRYDVSDDTLLGMYENIINFDEFTPSSEDWNNLLRGKEWNPDGHYNLDEDCGCGSSNFDSGIGEQTGSKLAFKRRNDLHEEENDLKKDIEEFWDTLTLDAYQSEDNLDGGYNAEWDTKFFIYMYPQYEGREDEINNIVSSMGINVYNDGEDNQLNESTKLKQRWQKLANIK